MMKVLIAIGALLCLNANGFSAAIGQEPDAKTLGADALTDLDAFISDLVEKDTFSGTVLLAKDGKVIYSAARGLASKRFSVPNNLQTKLNLGSMNKMFTATAMMQLVEQNKISLDDKLDQFLDDSWLGKDISSKIEIQHLLTHSSGLGSYFTEDFFSGSKNKFRALADYKPLIVGSTLRFEPGTDYRYSNTGMFLLGAVIEAVSGQDYFSYIDQYIYEPAAMINSGCYEMDQPVPNLAIGYTPDESKATGWVNNLYMHVLKGGPAGGCFSTVEDMLRFANALTNYRLLSEKNTKALYTSKPAFHQESYGYGFNISGTPNNRIVGHSGGFLGINGNLDIFIDDGYVSVVLANYGGAARPVAEKIRDLVKQ